MARVASIAVSILLLSIQSCWAYEYESVDHLNELARGFILKNVPVAPDESLDIQVGQTPLQLSKCSNDIQVSFPQNYNPEKINSVELSCNGNVPWHAFMPIDVQVNTKVLIVTRTILPKEKINQEDLDYTYFNKSRLYNGYFKDKSEVIGETVSHTIAAGTILNKKNIQSPVVVLKNQTITLVVQRNSIVISMQGVAKTDGAINTTIKVYNPSSQKTVDAVVIGPSKAQVI